MVKGGEGGSEKEVWEDGERKQEKREWLGVGSGWGKSKSKEDERI